MAKKLIFLSHIHEERELALMFQSALDSEFSGFVDVFVSSDGSSIPTGSNFLKRIEDGLVSCVAGIYLISPPSVAKTWLSFELGAVWIRNVLNVKAGRPEIPTLPFCHSGMTPSSLPTPLNVLNAIEANHSGQLSMAFRSLQTSVGGKGNLKTDFSDLASKVASFETHYTLHKNFRIICDLLQINPTEVVTGMATRPAESVARLEGIVEMHRLGDMKLALERLKGFAVGRQGTFTSTVNNAVARAGHTYEVTIDRRAIG